MVLFISGYTRTIDLSGYIEKNPGPRLVILNLPFEPKK